MTTRQHDFIASRTKSGSGSNFISARTGGSNGHKPKSELPKHRVRGRKIGSWRRIRFMRSWELASRRFGWRASVVLISKTPAGTKAHIKFDHDNAELELTKTAEILKGTFHVRDIVVLPDRTDASRATLHLIEHDLLLERAGTPWPGMQAQTLSLWDPIDFGWDWMGNPVRLSVMGRHAGLFGETGAGKGSAQSVIVATAALSGARLFLFDANRIQLSRWHSVAEEFVVDDMAEATRVLDYLLTEIDRRNQIVSDHGFDKLDRTLSEQVGEPPLLLVIDEGADYLRIKDFTTQLTRLCARGRAAGLCVVFTTQSPNATIIPTPLRNNLGLRAVFRVADKSASNVALGTSSMDASSIAPEDRGVCYLHQDGLLPTRMRTFYPTPEQVRELAKRATKIRGIPTP